MARIFISHSSEDKDFARKLAEDLKTLGHAPWLDEWEIKVGESIVQKISDAVTMADYVIVVLTPHSVESGWVEREWQSAYHSEVEKRRVVVLPLLFRQCTIPQLLRDKMYADFRSSYPVGLAQLAQSIVPADQEGLVSPLSGESKTAWNVSELLSKVQGKQVSLAQCIAEALPLAQSNGDREFVEFCRQEMAGYTDAEINGGHVPRYRSIEVFCSVKAKVNPQYIGWGGANNMFAFMEENPDDFFIKRMFVSRPIAEIVEEETRDPSKSFFSWTQPMSSFLPDAKDPDAPVWCCAKGNAYASVVESVRTELTTRLLGLLPEM